MAFKVRISFDEPADFYEMLAGLTKPDPRLGTVINSLHILSEGVFTMNAALQARLDTLTQRVAAVDGAEQSVLALVTEMRAQLSGLRDELAAGGVDEAQLASLDALNEKLGSEVQQIADAVAAPAPAPVEQPPAPPVDVPVEPTPVDPAAPGEGVPPVVTDPADTTTIPPDPANT